MEENSGAGACGYPKKKALLLFNALLLSVGNCGGPLIMRLYFLRGGNRVWLSSALETAGWPAVLVPILASYILRRRAPPVQDAKRKLFVIGRRVFLASAAVGILIGLDDYFYAYGMARLPVSTSSLIIAAQLAFTAVFAFLLVRQRFTAYSVNAVFLLTVGAGVLALHTSGDRPAGESGREYLVGFLMTVAAAVLYGFILPAVELVYKKAKQEMSYSLVMEIQMVMCIFATGFCTVGMLVNHDFQAISREAKDYELGEAKYYTVLVSNAIIWQCFFLGSIGVVFCASSLLSGVIIAMLLPMTEILAVFFFHEKFQAEKGVALALSLWGFLSYFYGELKHSKTESPRAETEMQQTV